MNSSNLVPAQCHVVLTLLLALACLPLEAKADEEISRGSYEIVRSIPHDDSSFTQGLIVDGDHIIETTGWYKKSKINVLQLSDGKAISSKPLPEDVWGEGLTKLDGKYFVLTYKEKKMYVIEPKSLEITNTINYEGEGWGLTTDGKKLVMSDGSDVITFRNPSDLSVIKKINVTFEGKKVEKINELEWVDGIIYANVWYTDIILAINPDNGNVVKWYDMAGIQFKLDHTDKNTNTLNGIAYDVINNKFYVTGKNWSNIFEIKLKTEIN